MKDIAATVGQRLVCYYLVYVLTHPRLSSIVLVSIYISCFGRVFVLEGGQFACRITTNSLYSAMKTSMISWLFLSMLDYSVARPTADPLLENGRLSDAADKHLRPVLEKRQQFEQGQPINAKGNGAPITGNSYSLCCCTWY